MAERNSLVDVDSGDQINEGYFDSLSFGVNTSLLANLNYALDGVTVTSQRNLVLNPDIGASSNALYGSQGILSTAKSVIFCLVAEAHDDSSVDSNIWTTATHANGANAGASVTENTVKMSVGASGGDNSGDDVSTASAISNGSSAIDAYSLSGNSEFVMCLSLITSPGNNGFDGDTEATFEISNGSTHVEIDKVTTGSDVIDAKYNLLFNKAGTEVRVWRDDVELGASPFDLSSVTTNWYFRFYAAGGQGNGTTGQGDDATVEVYFIGYIDGTSETGQITTDAVSLDKASTTSLVKFTSDQSDETSFTVKASADGGSNYTIMDMDGTLGGDGQITGGLTSGTSAKLRFEIPLITSVSTSTPQLNKYVFTWAAYYG